MSKNLTRKGLAFGALVALTASVISGAPASADANSPVSLLPNAGGTTFNSILESGIVLKSDIDATQVSANAAAASTDATDDAADLSFFVTNADERKITIALDGSAGSTDNDKNYYELASATATSTTHAFTLETTDAEHTAKYQTMRATNGNAAGLTGNTLTISTSETTKVVTLVVQPWIDRNHDGVPGAFEKKGKAETVILYPVSEVSATTTINNLTVGATVAATTFNVTTVYNKDINPYAVSGRTAIRLVKNGAELTFTAAATSLLTNNAKLAPVAVAADDAGTGILAFKKNTLTAGVTSSGTKALSLDAVEPAVYTAQAVYNTLAAGTWATADNLIQVGAASAILDLTAGGNADVTGIKKTFLNTKDAISSDATETSEIKVRAATKSIELGAQVLKTGPANLEAANIPVKAVVSATALDATSSITVSGATGTLVKDGAAITAYGRTDAAGKASFTITSTTGKSGDAIDVVLYVKDNNGSWVAQTDVTTGTDIKWFATAYDSFAVKGGAYISGAKPSVTFQAVDQFGQGVDTYDSKKLSVYAVATFGGIADTTKYAETVVLSGGKATFTFDNFAPANGSAQLVATLFSLSGSTSTKVGSSIAVNVYNAPATKEITVASSFKTNITYKDFVTGDKSDAAVAKKISDAGIAGTVDISGTVLNVNNAGQNGLPVTVSFPGALLIDGDTYAADKIVTKTNEYGYFTVSVAVHTVNTKGATVTISADGKTATTLVKSYLPSDLGAANLAFSWSLPAFLVKDTTYAATLKLTDKWGNAVKTTSKTQQGVTVSATGALQVNGVSTDVERNFDKNGQVTIYLRSVSKIAGPAEVTATLNTDAAYAVSADATDSLDALDAITTDVTTTVWDETKFSDELSAEVVVRDLAPKATITKATNSSVVVKNASGLTIKVVRGSKVTTKVATSDSQKITLKGGKGTVKVYVNGVKVASK